MSEVTPITTVATPLAFPSLTSTHFRNQNWVPIGPIKLGGVSLRKHHISVLALYGRNQAYINRLLFLPWGKASLLSYLFHSIHYPNSLTDQCTSPQLYNNSYKEGQHEKDYVTLQQASYVDSNLTSKTFHDQEGISTVVMDTVLKCVCTYTVQKETSNTLLSSLVRCHGDDDDESELLLNYDDDSKNNISSSDFTDNEYTLLPLPYLEEDSDEYTSDEEGEEGEGEEGEEDDDIVEFICPIQCNTALLPLPTLTVTMCNNNGLTPIIQHVLSFSSEESGFCERNHSDWSDEEEEGDQNGCVFDEGLWHEFESKGCFNDLFLPCPSSPSNNNNNKHTTTTTNTSTSSSASDITVTEDEASTNTTGTNKGSSRRVVSFSPHKPRIHLIVAWKYAYQRARKGNWEQYALDRDRFRKRIDTVHDVIKPCLLKKLNQVGSDSLCTTTSSSQQCPAMCKD